MGLKINNGPPFMHQFTGVMIGPGQFYDDYEEVVQEKTASTKRNKKSPSEGENTNGSSEPTGDTQG